MPFIQIDEATRFTFHREFRIKWKKIDIKERTHIPVRRMAPSDTGDRLTDRETDRQNGSYTARSFILEGVSVSVHACTSIAEYTRITVDKWLREQLCRCMCVVKAGGGRGAPVD